MLFNSVDFALFFVVVYGLYLVLNHRWQNVLLLAASYFFYACWDWRYLGLIWAATAVDYVAGLRIAEARSSHTRRIWLAISVFAHLAMLGFFKYYGFFLEPLGALLGALGLPFEKLRLDLVLPVGISFYTFQTMSYTIDIYRRKMQPTRNVIDFSLFVAYFPQLVAGPIERAKRLLPQIASARRVTAAGFFEGLHLMAWGIVKKVVIADNLARIVDYAYSPGIDCGCWSVIVATVAFAFQIYCDFSGYSDVARGCGKCMGIDLMLNFNLPYFATSVQDFWRRWHISLSTWFRDYVYIPLGGSRCPAWKTCRNILITMMIAGMWHGASWTFVLWGTYFGVLLVAHRAIFGNLPPRSWHEQTSVAGRARWLGAALGTFALVCFGWIIFRSESFGTLRIMLGKLLTLEPLALSAIKGKKAILYIAPLLLMDGIQYFKRDLDWALHLHWLPRGFIYAGFMFALMTFGVRHAEQFIYFQF